MSQYQRREDLTIIPDLLGLAATEGSAFMAFHHSMEREDGAIPRKYRGLIALGVAFTTQCSYCIRGTHPPCPRARRHPGRGGGSRLRCGRGKGRRNAGAFADGAAALSRRIRNRVDAAFDRRRGSAGDSHPGRQLGRHAVDGGAGVESELAGISNEGCG